MPPPQSTNTFQNTYSYPQYQNQPMQRNNGMNNNNNNQNPFYFGTFGNLNNGGSFNPNNFLQQIGQSFNMMIENPRRVFNQPRRRTFNFY